MKPSLMSLSTPLAIGSAVVPNRVFLAPMSGISDKPFRKLADGFGAGLVISEMTAGEKLAIGDREARLRTERAGDGPHVVQLAGREAHWMAEGARAAEGAGADIIDINMGCPARKVTGGYSGSALMRDLDHALRLIDATVGATTRPVTLKMRLGWDDKTLNAPDLARRAEAAGVKMVTVHGRTRCQFYTGVADWRAIRRVKEAVDIPVIANGDLVDFDQLGSMLALSGADGIMIGRGACGRPWFPGHVAQFAQGGSAVEPPAQGALVELIRGHHDDMLVHYGTRVGLRAARKHLSWYLDHAGVAPASPSRRLLLTDEDPKHIGQLVSHCLEEHAERLAA